MHTSIISFADRVVYNIKTNEMKDSILEMLYNKYSVKIIQKHYHKVDENNIKHINSNPHLCCLRSNGNPYFMLMTTYNDIPIIYFIDKKIHPGYQKPRILLVRGLFSESLFKNTLIDGEMVKTSDNKWIFIMNDIIVYEGNHLNNTILTDRLNILYQILSSKYTPDSTIDVCTYKVKSYFILCKESITKLIDISKKLNYTCRGIYFWSQSLKYKPKLYNFNEENIVSVTRKVKDETEFQLKTDKIDISKEQTNQENIINVINIEKYIPCDTDTEKILWLSQTDYPDVYNVYETENILTSKKMGVALIPNLITSKMIRNAFKNKNSVSLVQVRCNFNSTFNKWYPVSVI